MKQILILLSLLTFVSSGWAESSDSSCRTQSIIAALKSLWQARKSPATPLVSDVSQVDSPSQHRAGVEPAATHQTKTLAPLKTEAIKFSAEEGENLVREIARTLEAKMATYFSDRYFAVKISFGDKFDITDGFGSGAEIVLSKDELIRNADGVLALEPEKMKAIETMVAHEAGHGLLGNRYSHLRAANKGGRGGSLDFIYRSIGEMYADLSAMAYRNDPKAVALAAKSIFGEIDQVNALRDYSVVRSHATIVKEGRSFYVSYSNLGAHLWKRYLANTSPTERLKRLNAIGEGIAQVFKRLELLSERDLAAYEYGSPIAQKAFIKAIFGQLK